jgi:hypothetical protein
MRKWPDGYVRLGKKTENVEVTIALIEGRRMGEEGEISRRRGRR